jgi:hypothetical protein
MRVVITAGITDDFSAFAVFASRAEIQIVHRNEDAPLRRFQTVPYIRQSSRNYHAHRVVQIGILDLIKDPYILETFLWLFPIFHKSPAVLNLKLQK